MARPAITLHVPEGLRVDYDPQVRVLRSAAERSETEVLGPPEPPDPVVLRLASPADIAGAVAAEYARRLAAGRRPRLLLTIGRADEISYRTIDELRALAATAEVDEVVVYVHQRG